MGFGRLRQGRVGLLNGYGSWESGRRREGKIRVRVVEEFAEVVRGSWLWWRFWRPCWARSPVHGI